MNDTKRIDDEIVSLQEEINRLESLKLQSCIDCEDKYCKHAGITDNIICQSHSIYGR